MKAEVISLDDWTVLFVNGLVVEEGHDLIEGGYPLQEYMKLIKAYGLTLDNTTFREATEEEQESAEKHGRLA